MRDNPYKDLPPLESRPDGSLYRMTPAQRNLPLDGTLKAEIFRDKDMKRCAVCGGVFVPKSNRAKYCPDCAARVHRRQKTESERKRRSAVDS